MREKKRPYVNKAIRTQFSSSFAIDQGEAGKRQHAVEEMVRLAVVRKERIPTFPGRSQ